MRLMGTRLRLFLTLILSYNAAANNTARWLTLFRPQGGG